MNTYFRCNYTHFRFSAPFCCCTTRRPSCLPCSDRKTLARLKFCAAWKTHTHTFALVARDSHKARTFVGVFSALFFSETNSVQAVQLYFIALNSKYSNWEESLKWNGKKKKNYSAFSCCCYFCALWYDLLNAYIIIIVIIINILFFTKKNLFIELGQVWGGAAHRQTKTHMQ